MPHQIFISYARVNDLADPGDEKGWVSTFVDFLNARLPGKLGADAIDIWKDDRLAGNNPVTEALRNSVAASSIFVMLSSEPYLMSDWCSNRELPQFLSKNLPGRIFRVELEKIDRGRFPEPLRDVIGYKFWSEDSQSKRVRLLKGMPQKFADEQFYLRLDMLVQDLANAIKAMAPDRVAPEKDASGAPSPANPPATQPAVFLASAVPELENERYRFQTYLNQSEVRVIGPESLPFERAAYLEALEAALGESVLFAQLLGQDPLAPVPDDAASDVALQLETAQRLGKPILQWRAPTLDLDAVTDEKHRALLQANTVEQMGIEEFKAFVAKRALTKPIAEAPLREAREGSLINGFVFLDRAIEDSKTVEPILEFLGEMKVDCVLPLDKGDPEEIRLDLEENLGSCEALIIVYGDAAPGWVRAQVRQYRKAKRDRPLELQGIYYGPPSKDDLGLALPALKIIPCRDGFAREKLLEFLRRP
jgi:hypothetical protein